MCRSFHSPQDRPREETFWLLPISREAGRAFIVLKRSAVPLLATIFPPAGIAPGYAPSIQGWPGSGRSQPVSSPLLPLAAIPREPAPASWHERQSRQRQQHRLARGRQAVSTRRRWWHQLPPATGQARTPCSHPDASPIARRVTHRHRQRQRRTPTPTGGASRRLYDSAKYSVSFLGSISS